MNGCVLKIFFFYLMYYYYSYVHILWYTLYILKFNSIDRSHLVSLHILSIIDALLSFTGKIYYTIGNWHINKCIKFAYFYKIVYIFIYSITPFFHPVSFKYILCSISHFYFPLFMSGVFKIQLIL